MAGIANVTSPESHRKYLTKPVTARCRPLQEIQPSELYDSKETLRDAEQGSSVRFVFGARKWLVYLCLIYLHTEIKVVFICSPSFSERQRKWKEELAEELERTRGKLSVFLTKKLQFPPFPPVGIWVGTSIFSL